jgi:hypothetical protein
MAHELTMTRPPLASARTADLVRARLGDAIPEMIAVIRRGVPDYADPRRPDYQQRLADAVTHVVAQFIGHLADPGASTATITAEFGAIGFTAAREGRTLDALQNALRLGARVAWHWLCQADVGLSRRELSQVGDAIFGYLDDLADACACGYADGCADVAGERERHRQRLADVLTAGQAASPELLASLATAAGWGLPSRVAVVLLSERAARLALPADVLADWDRAEPCLVIPDPDGPGRGDTIDRALRGWPGLAAIGPSVALDRTAWSLRWARRALVLARRGIIPAGQPVRCEQQVATLVLLADEDLARTLLSSRLTPLERLRPGQRDRIAETMLAWLQLGENAAKVAERMHVHPQTVRYRLRQIHDLFGDQLRDPDARFELQLALRARELLARDDT